jgi:S-methylmethionine-dependent homocysteine/selenocysteine methylase
MIKRTKRKPLPQLADQLFMSDGGLETTLIFHEKIELPMLAAFPLVRDAFGRKKLLEYFRRYGDIAWRHQLGLILESPTWRANPDWTRQLSPDPDYLGDVNRLSIRLMEQIRDEYRDTVPATVISGNLGPRGDGYVPSNRMSAEEAEAYHSEQIRVLADTAADLVSAFTLNYVEEAIGITRAAVRHDIPVVISFTVETDGRLPAGQSLKESIEAVDAATRSAPAYYMINCSHPTHFADQLKTNEAWVKRIRGIRANASRCSHAELNDAPELDTGDPIELGERYAELRALLPHLTVIGGCCGTDHRHVTAMCEAVLPNRNPNLNSSRYAGKNH